MTQPAAPSIRSSSFLAATAAALLAAPLTAQAPDPGHRVYCPTGTDTTFMVDAAGNTIHSWPSTAVVGNTVYVEEDGTLLRAIRTGVLGPGGGTGGGVERIAYDGTQTWRFDYDSGGVIHHHDVESMPNGNVLLIAWESKTQAEAVQAGRNPALITGSTFFPDHIVEVEPTGPTTGDIVWEWHVWDHLIQDFDATKDNFGVVADHPELIDVNFPPNSVADWNHSNSVDYDPVNDWIVISANFQDEIWIVDHSTTTAEAAGHTGGARGKGGDLLWRWGNPQAYDAGGPGDQALFRQHGVKFIPEGYDGAGNLILYNNQIAPTSRIEELVLPLDGGGDFIDPAPGGSYGPAAPVWTYQDPAMNSAIMSSAERLPNGNTLIASSLQGRMFEITSAGTIVWEVASATPFRVSYVDRTLWTDTREISYGTPGSRVDFDLAAGSQHAGDLYYLLGSASGTDPGVPLGGMTLPLNPDFYTTLAFNKANNPVFPGFIGTLDADGNATASLVNPIVLPATIEGLELHHAFVVRDAVLNVTEHISNAENAVFVP